MKPVRLLAVLLWLILLVAFCCAHFEFHHHVDLGWDEQPTPQPTPLPDLDQGDRG